MNLIKNLTIAACLVPMAAFASSTISGSFIETQDMTATYLVWADPVGAGYVFQAQEIISSAQTVTAGTTENFSVTDGTSGTPTLYTLMGVYQSGGANTGVVLGANTFVADFFLLGSPWPFSSFISETDAMNLLLTDSAASLLNGVGVNTDQTINSDFQQAAISVGTSGTLVNFSNGTNGGSIGAQSQAVPEPMSIIALLGGVGALLRRGSVK